MMLKLEGPVPLDRGLACAAIRIEAASAHIVASAGEFRVFLHCMTVRAAWWGRAGDGINDRPNVVPAGWLKAAVS